MIEIVYVQKHELQHAFDNGASNLEQACALTDGELTLSLLKAMIFRGEKMLFAVKDDEIKGWFVASIMQKPQSLCFHIYAAQGKGAFTQECGEKLKNLARQYGCLTVECNARGSAAKLWLQRGFVEINKVLSVRL